MKGLYSENYRHKTVFVYGEVTIGEGTSLWTYSVIRSEFNQVVIGKYTNIQDFVMIHVGDKTDTIIGDYCTIAHRAVIHGATIGNNCLVGVGAIIMDGCIVGDNVIIGAGSYLPPGTKIPNNSIVQGNPAIIVKQRNNFVTNRMNAIYYNINAEHYEKGNHRSWSDPIVKRKIKSFFVEVNRAFKEKHQQSD